MSLFRDKSQPPSHAVVQRAGPPELAVATQDPDGELGWQQLAGAVRRPVVYHDNRRDLRCRPPSEQVGEARPSVLEAIAHRDDHKQARVSWPARQDLLHA